MDDAYLPDDDLDLALARAVERGAVDADPLLTRLAPLRLGAAVPAARTAALWSSIEAHTRPSILPRGRADRAPVAAPRRVVRWVTAGAFASLALLAAVAVLTLQPVRDLIEVQAARSGDPTPVRLADGSTILLRAGAHLTQLAADDDHVRFTLQGEALFDVTHNPERRFEVATAGGTVAVLGTRFSVAALDDSTTVLLERGRVEMTSPRGAQRVLAPGEAATSSPRGLQDARASDAESLLDWTQGRLSFRHTPASDVAAELARHYGVDVSMPEAVNAETVSGSLSLGTAGASFDALGRVLGGRFVRSADGSFRFAR